MPRGSTVCTLGDSLHCEQLAVGMFFYENNKEVHILKEEKDILMFIWFKGQKEICYVVTENSCLFIKL